MKKLSVCFVLLCSVFFSAYSAAKSEAYLEEKTAYCFSEKSLSKYLDHARLRDIEGLNRLVFSGECDFVPDGETYSLNEYKKSKINTMAVVAFEKDQQTLWTFQALVQKGEI